MDDADYAALGRYTTSAEAIKRITAEFNRQVQDLGDQLKRCYHKETDTFGNKLPSFDSAKMRSQMDEIATLYESIMDHGREANIYAERCGKPPFKMPR